MTAPETGYHGAAAHARRVLPSAGVSRTAGAEQLGSRDAIQTRKSVTGQGCSGNGASCHQARRPRRQNTPEPNRPLAAGIPARTARNTRRTGTAFGLRTVRLFCARGHRVGEGNGGGCELERRLSLNGYIDDGVCVTGTRSRRPVASRSAVRSRTTSSPDDVHIRLNSATVAACNAAVRMFDDVRAYPGSVRITVISGTAASAATVLAMAADRLEMTPGSLWMIHDPSSVVAWGNERELRWSSIATAAGVQGEHPERVPAPVPAEPPGGGRHDERHIVAGRAVRVAVRIHRRCRRRRQAWRAGERRGAQGESGLCQSEGAGMAGSP